MCALSMVSGREIIESLKVQLWIDPQESLKYTYMSFWKAAFNFQSVLTITKETNKI